MEMLSPTLSGEQSNLRADVKDKSGEKSNKDMVQKERCIIKLAVGG